ncbi:hypothetical protein [Streptomyces sp. H51]|nr:hypothetical protein [Streptomyces sp. H51]
MENTRDNETPTNETDAEFADSAFGTWLAARAAEGIRRAAGC